MADYYPLISRAVANLGPSTPEQRRELYARATNALIGQLRTSQPPIPESDITRERLSLEEAIGRVETEVAGGLVRDHLSPVETGPIAPPTEREPAPVPPPPAARGPATALEPERVVEPPVEPGPAADGPPPALAVQRQSQAPAATPREVLPDEEVLPGQPETIEPPAPERVEDIVREPVAPGRPRPPAPRLEQRDRRWVRAAVIGLAIALVVGLTATAAMMLKHQPADFQPQSSVASAPAEAERKAQERLPGEAPPAVVAAPAAPVAPAAPAPGSPPGSPAPAGTPAPAETAPLGILQRVLLVEEPEQGSKEFKQTAGRVRWRFENVSGGAGEPLDAAVRADVEVPEAGLKVGMLLRRNRDAALPASHTLEMKIDSSPTAPNGRVRDVAVPEMRQDETMRGTPLVGIAVPVTESLFLVGLSNLPGDVQRNLDLLRGRNWIMVPVRYANGRRALLLIEKGPTGTRSIADAIQSWQQG